MCLRVVSRARGGFWGVRQHCRYQVLKCSVVWFCPVGGFLWVSFLVTAFKCWGFLRAWLMTLQLLFVNTTSSCVSFSPTLPPILVSCKGKNLRLYQGTCGNIWRSAIFEFSDYCWQMNAMRVFLFKNNFHCKMYCKNTVVLSSLPAHYIPNKVPNQKACE